MPTFFMLTGFLLAAYATVANDSIQTLGTFFASNHHRPWWLLWMYISGIATSVLLAGWWMNQGDPAYGLLDRFPFQPAVYSWIVIVPPLVLLVLTRWGYPVSTTFLLLTFFVPGNLQAMLIKSLVGYIAAFAVGYGVFFAVAKLAAHYLKTDRETPHYWMLLQWISTGFLWCQWLIQDLANIFIYLPRPLPASHLGFGLAALIVLQGVLIFQRGGRIQKVVTSKANIDNIRAATIVDLVYAVIIYAFKNVSNIPMSTTWVFLGLLAGREVAIAMATHLRTMKKVRKLVVKDLVKALVGLAVSVILAFSLPALAELVDGWFTG